LLDKARNPKKLVFKFTAHLSNTKNNILPLQSQSKITQSLMKEYILDTQEKFF